MKYKYTILIQGPVSSVYEIRDKIKSINALFPNAEIVFSTWGNGDVEKININTTILFNKEIENDHAVGDKWAINFRRQCVSVLAGLSYSNGEYVVKMRSDSIFKNNMMESHLSKFISSKKKFLITRKLIPYPHPFYSEDFFIIGKRTELLELWTNAINHEQCLMYYKEFKPTIYDKYTKFYARYHPEQIIYMSQFGNKNYSRGQKSLLKFIGQFNLLEKTNYCIGKKNIGLLSAKHQLTMNDWCCNQLTFYPINQIRAILSILYGLLCFMVLLINEKK